MAMINIDEAFTEAMNKAKGRRCSCGIGIMPDKELGKEGQNLLIDGQTRTIHCRHCNELLLQA